MDYIVLGSFAGYLALMLGIGFFFSRKSSGVREYQCVIVPKSSGIISPRSKAYFWSLRRSSPRYWRLQKRVRSS